MFNRSRVASAPTRPASIAPASPSAAVRGISQMAMFAALIAVLGQLPAIPLAGGVPITLQTLGVMLAGAVLGPWRGAGAVMLLHALVAAGLPLLAQGSGGLGAFAGPSAGFALGWIPGAFLVGLITQASWPLRLWRTILGVTFGGIVVVYACGLPVLAFQMGLSLEQAALINLAFLPGDVLKAVIAVALTHSLARAYPTPFSHARRRRR
ncbi:biotin transporter BioY [Nesterenkonia jeotgali]|uniref:Biotin transporter n=1 Tax=Nesterenkonia jeotgali TaxID=317018 RepID=A0A839FNB0_9MICC|nr:biotin transporter BioY [Nesterenkonia jeotgali]MBA8920141.1 biotin transport system substrate-specific component [Nesterenkonia jeotgali]